MLAPRDPSTHTNSDEWPEFELKNVRVRTLDQSDPDTMSSLLLASEHYPLRVTGELQPLPKSLSHLYLQPSSLRTTLIEVAEVRTLAYGQFSDGSVALWAAGKAGWYTIKPSRAYRPVYDDMIEAVNLLYFIADAYREPRTRRKGKKATPLPDYTTEELFEKYARHAVGSLADAARAADKMYKHREFLMASMIVGKENVAWGRNPLYTHLRKKFAADYKAVAERLAGPPKKAATNARSRQTSVETSSTTSSLKRKRGRPPKNRDADVIVGRALATELNPIEDTNKMAGVNDIAHAKPTHVRTRRTRQGSSAPAPEKNLEAPIEMEPVATPVPEEREDSEEEDDLPFASKGKSALRPRPSKASKSAARGSTHEDGEENEIEPRSSPIGGKRRQDENDETRQSKRRNSKQEVDEGIDMPESPSATSIDPPTPDATSGALDEHSSDLAVRLKHAVDPVQEDTWICALDGCTHKVYLASQPDSQRLIREHYALHAYDDDRRVQMVKKLQAPSLPVNHLMEKVRLQAKLEGFPGSRVAGTRFPQVVVQRN